MATLNSIIQYRTLNHVYLFKAQTESTLVLKIYDLSQACISKTTFSFSELGLSKTSFTLADLSTLIETLHQKKLIPFQGSPKTPTLEEGLQNIEQIIAQVKPKVVFESKELEKFCCPITFEVFKDPVVDNHGHTFERSAIEAQRKLKNECPINRAPIETLTPNRAIQQVIEETQKQDPIPTFVLFKKKNPQLAESSLKMAQAFMEAEEYEDALSAYLQAFQYTKESTDYAQLPALFERMGQKDKAWLAYLYLIQYQLQDIKVGEALQTLEQCRKSYPEFIQIIPLLVKLYRFTQAPAKALACALESGEALDQEHPREALVLYRELIAEDPCQWKAYPVLARLLQNPRQRAHILLKGACHALQKKEYPIAKSLCEQAQQSYKDSFIDRLIDLEFLAKQGLPTEEKLLEIALIFEKKQLSPHMIKAYRILTQIKYDPSYYEKIISGYDQIQKPEKALQWTLKWLSLLIDGHEWKQAETVSNKALQRTQQKIPLYEQQEIIYTRWHGHELNELWGRLGKAYVQNGQLFQAERTYQKAFSQFNTFEHAVALADTFILQDKIAAGVKTYYEASSIALLKDRLEDLSRCVGSIQQVDPEMKYLKLSQRMMLLTQSRLLELSTELSLTQKELKELKEQVKPSAVQTAVPVQAPKATTHPEWVFGASEWNKYFGEVGAEPPLPNEILQRLPELSANNVLVLIPATVNGQPLILKTLGELVKNPRNGGHKTQFYSFWNLGEYFDRPAQSHWALLTRKLIEGSRTIAYKYQQTIINRYSKSTQIGYEIPTVLDAAVCNFMEYVRNGKWLYAADGFLSFTFTYCQENYGPKQNFLVGGGDKHGLRLSSSYGSANSNYGIGGLKKSF